MKSIELTAYCVREYDIKYTVVLDENDPILVKYLADNDLVLEDLLEASNRDLWDTFMSETEDMVIDEDGSWAEERFVDFDAFIREDK